ncbi:Zn-dependent hydrolase [Niveispirillum irakense]|uniref:Zn-dependent hydrolase n=1 Tax=Niveispirillum irakense TaxID=34011 RepID=UPI0003FDE9AA|nr:Zn-dependent hydrolase [Niveispirillum irakense]
MALSPAPAGTVSRFVNQARLAQRLADMARIGATAKGGVNRQALSVEDGQARALLTGWAVARGFDVATDGIGNLFVRRAGSNPDAAPVMTGSHLDSQPTGGRYDGVYGVLAGFEVLEALEDAGITTRHPVEVVAWTNEEGSRFQPYCMGSALFAGKMDLEMVLACTDPKGISVRDALAETLALAPPMPSRPFGTPAAAYVEAHIEQGPRLEAEGLTIGVVQGIQGSRWFQVEVTGQEAHAGTTPHGARKDAFQTALRMVTALNDLMHDPDDIIRCTFGRFEVLPGSPNTVPGKVIFTIDFRHPDAGVVKEKGDAIAPLLHSLAAPCTVMVKETSTTAPVDFDPLVVEAVRDAAGLLGLSHRDMPSGANHDAKFMAPRCPTGMIFIPCKDGISHNEVEYASPEHCHAGAAVLAETLVRLAV